MVGAPLRQQAINQQIKDLPKNTDSRCIEFIGPCPFRVSNFQTHISDWYILCFMQNSRASCQKGPTHHAYAWQIGPFWQDTLELHSDKCYRSSLWMSQPTGWFSSITQQGIIPTSTDQGLWDHIVSPLDDDLICLAHRFWCFDKSSLCWIYSSLTWVKLLHHG